jgi:hypothetical protein
MSGPVVFTGRIQGQTSGGAAITTATPVTLHSDNTLSYTDALGVVRNVPIDSQFAPLIDLIFKGTNGYNTGRFLNKPVLTINGTGGRTDS